MEEEVMGNPFCWMELTTHDLEGAAKFYQEVFDWEIKDMPGGPMPYKLVTTGSEPGGGLMSIPEPGIDTCWTAYIQVDAIEAACAKVEENGGKVWKQPQEVPGMGRFAIVCDPQGAYFALWQNLEQK
jgi:predicted enzyme related to lactoylglutathione lyase